MKKKKTRRKALETKLDDKHKKKVRLRDSNEFGVALCIACGSPTDYGTSNCQAAHYIPKGQSKFLRWEDDNVNVCCYRCNISLKGNYHNYRKGMEDKYGKKRERQIWNLRHKLSEGIFTLDWLEKRIKEEEEEIKLLQGVR